MVIERKWKRWVYFYIPLTIFVIGTLFPFYWMLITAIRPDAELYRSWRAANNAPFWTLAPTLDHFRDLLHQLDDARVLRAADANDGADAVAEPGQVHRGAVARDDAGIFKLPNPLDHGRRGQADLPA